MWLPEAAMLLIAAFVRGWSIDGLDIIMYRIVHFRVILYILLEISLPLWYIEQIVVSNLQTLICISSRAESK